MSDPRFNMRQHTFQVCCSVCYQCASGGSLEFQSEPPSRSRPPLMTQGHCTCPLMSTILSALRPTWRRQSAKVGALGRASLWR